MNPPTVANPNPDQNQDDPTGLKKEIRHGEILLVRVGIATLAINAFIAVIYICQLQQMRIATQDSTAAVRLANETLQYNASQFDRGMRQTIGQGSTQFQATQESIVAANAAKSAADTARDSLEASERPWLVSKVSIVGPMTFDKNEARITLHYSITNVGHSPATGVMIHPEIYVPTPKNNRMAMEERQRLCKDLGGGSPRFGDTIFPGQPYEIDQSFGVTRSDIDAGFAVGWGKYLASYVVDCLVYHANFTNRIYSVASDYFIAEANPQGMWRMLTNTNDKPLGSIMLMQEPLYPRDVDVEIKNNYHPPPKHHP